jgi:hypothetical protein
VPVVGGPMRARCGRELGMQPLMRHQLVERGYRGRTCGNATQEAAPGDSVAPQLRHEA